MNNYTVAVVINILITVKMNVNYMFDFLTDFLGCKWGKSKDIISEYFQSF